MRTIYLIAALPILVLVGLSLLAGYAIGDLQQIPMQWGSDGSPTWYAPKWIGLFIPPAIGLIVMLNVVIARYGKTTEKHVKEIIISGLIIISCHLFYLFLLGKYVSSSNV